ncbi:gG21000 [Clostridium sp. CAG:964]|nr:gG21000 [Clostridium sp. CAG:964]
MNNKPGIKERISDGTYAAIGVIAIALVIAAIVLLFVTSANSEKSNGTEAGSTSATQVSNDSSSSDSSSSDSRTVQTVTAAPLTVQTVTAAPLTVQTVTAAPLTVQTVTAAPLTVQTVTAAPLTVQTVTATTQARAMTSLHLTQPTPTVQRELKSTTQYPTLHTMTNLQKQTEYISSSLLLSIQTMQAIKRPRLQLKRTKTASMRASILQLYLTTNKQYVIL